MIPIYRMKVIQIEVTNACNLGCSNCTRMVGHHTKPYFMPLMDIAKSIDSLIGYEGQIGIMGGEPTLHPNFPEICLLMQQKVSRRKRELWTNGFKWNEYKQIIEETFDADLITYNDHMDKTVGVHQPLLIAIQDVIKDRELMWQLIGNCWVQWRWGASITPAGGFFCEVAGALNKLFGYGKGYKIERDWWNKNPNEFLDQVRDICVHCGGAIPIKGVNSNVCYDIVSPSNEKRLMEIGSPKALQGNYKVYENQLTRKDIEKTLKKGWTPWSHRPYKQSSPEVKWK